MFLYFNGNSLCIRKTILSEVWFENDLDQLKLKTINYPSFFFYSLKFFIIFFEEIKLHSRKLEKSTLRTYFICYIRRQISFGRLEIM